jgi:hypothetical protein
VNTLIEEIAEYVDDEKLIKYTNELLEKDPINRYKLCSEFVEQHYTNEGSALSEGEDPFYDFQVG